MLSLRPLPDKLKEKAKIELNEDAEQVEEYLRHIEDWLSKQQHLYARRDRQYLLNFLRSAKFSLQRTKVKLDYFYMMKSAWPEICANKDPCRPEIERIIKQGIFLPITKSTADAAFPAVYFALWERADSETMPYVNIVKVFLMYLDALLKEDDNFSVSGCYFIHDLRNMPLGYVEQITPTLCKKVVISLQQMYPYRLKGVYFFNVPKIYEVVINMFISFASNKLVDRIKVFTEENMDEMYEDVPKKFFPKDYGGDAESLDELTAMWYKRLNENREWFLEEDLYKADESKRMEEATTCVDIFGMERSYRKLDID